VMKSIPYMFYFLNKFINVYEGVNVRRVNCISYMIVIVCLACSEYVACA
jgi:hypothetical protein